LRGCGLHRSGDTRYSAAAYRWRLMWLLCSFQGPSRGVYAGRRWVHAGALFARLPHHRRTPVSQNSTACWHRCGLASIGLQVVRSLPLLIHPARFGRHARPVSTVTTRISRFPKEPGT